MQCVESSPEILEQIAELVIPPINFYVGTQYHGYGPASPSTYLCRLNFLEDLVASVYDLIDSVTYKRRAIPANMWPVFELTYKLFKSEEILTVRSVSSGSLSVPC